MAQDIVARNLLVRLKAEYEEFIRKNKEASGSFEAAVYSIEKNKAKLREIGLVFGTVGAAVGAAMGGAAKAAIDFNKELANLATLIPGDAGRLEEWRNALQDMSVQYGKSSAEMVQGAYQVVSAFGDSADAVKKLEIANKAAAAGASTTKEAVDLLVAVTKGYGDSSAEACQKASDLAFMTVKQGVTDFPQLAASIGRVIPNAAALGVSLEEVSGVFATATGATGKAAEVSTQFAGILRALMTPTEDMTKLLNKYGYENGEAMLKARGLQGALNLVAKEQKETGIGMQRFLGSSEAVTLALALTGKQSEEFTKKLGDMKNAAGATEEAFKAQTEGVNKTGFALSQMKQSFITLTQTIGEALVPLVAAAATAFKNMTETVRTFLKEHPNLTKALAIGAAAFATLATAIGTLLLGATAIPSLVTAFGTLLTSIKAVSAFLMGPWGIALAAAAGAVYLIIKYWDELAAGMQTLYIEIIQPVIEAMKGAFSSIWEVAKQVWNFIWEKVKSVLQAMWEFFSPVVDFYISAFQNIWQVVETVFGYIWDKVKTVIGAMYESFRWLLDKLGVELPEIGEIFSDIGDSAGSITDAITAKWDSMKETFRRQMGEVKDVASQADQAIVEDHAQAVGEIDALQDGFVIRDKQRKEKQKKEVDDYLEYLKHEYGEALDSTQQQQVKKLMEMGLDWEAYADHIVKEGETEDASVMAMVKARYGGYLDETQLKTAQTLAVMGGEWESYAQGIVAEGGTMNRIRFSIESHFKTAAEAANKAFSDIGTAFISDIMHGNLGAAFRHMKNAFTDIVRNMGNDLIGSLSKALTDWIGGGFKSILGSITGSISKAIGGTVTGAAGTAVSKIGGAVTGAASSIGGAVTGVVGALGTIGTLGIGGAVAGVIFSLKKLFGGIPKHERRRRDDAKDTFPAIARDIEADFNRGKISKEEAEFKLALLQKAIESGEVLNTMPQAWAEARGFKGSDLAKHSRTRHLAFMKWLDYQWSKAKPVEEEPTAVTQTVQTLIRRPTTTRRTTITPRPPEQRGPGYYRRLEREAREQKAVVTPVVEEPVEEAIVGAVPVEEKPTIAVAKARPLFDETSGSPVRQAYARAYNNLLRGLKGTAYNKLWDMLSVQLEKYHAGGVIRGILGQEKVINAVAGEEVITRSDPRHSLNFGGGIVVNITGNSISSMLDMRKRRCSSEEGCLYESDGNSGR